MNPEQKQSLHGLMAEFGSPDAALAAARRVYEEGYRRVDAYTPFPVEGLAEALGQTWDAVPLCTLLGGLAGGLGGYWMQWDASTRLYPLNVGGRPLHSWPMFIAITFELTVLAASLSAVLSMLLLNRLPQPYHPVFNAPPFVRASRDRFFLCIEAADPKFDLGRTTSFLTGLQPLEVMEVEK